RSYSRSARQVNRAAASWSRGAGTRLAEAVRHRDEHRASRERKRERVGGLVVGQILHLPRDADVRPGHGQLNAEAMIRAATDALGVDLRTVEHVVRNEVEVVEDTS